MQSYDLLKIITTVQWGTQYFLNKDAGDWILYEDGTTFSQGKCVQYFTKDLGPYFI